MGAAFSSSFNVSDVVNNSLSNVLLNYASNCAQNNSSLQSINFNNIKAGKNCQLKFSNISQSNLQSPNFSCSSNSSNNSDLAAQFSNSLQQQAQAQTSGLSGALVSSSNSTTMSKLANTITNNINMSDVSNCVQNILAKQTLNWSNITIPDCTGCGLQCNQQGTTCINTCEQDWDTISQNLVSSAVGNCLNANQNVSSATQNAQSQVAQATSAANTGIDVAGSCGSSICLILIILIIYYML